MKLNFLVILTILLFIGCVGDSSSNDKKDTETYYSVNDLLYSYKTINSSTHKIIDIEDDVLVYDTNLVDTKDLTLEELLNAKLYRRVDDQEKHSFIDIKEVKIEITNTQIIGKLTLKSLDFTKVDISSGDPIDLSYDIIFDLPQNLIFSYFLDPNDLSSEEAILMEEDLTDSTVSGEVLATLNYTISGNILTFTIDKTQDTRLNDISYSTPINAYSQFSPPETDADSRTTRDSTSTN